MCRPQGWYSARIHTLRCDSSPTRVSLYSMPAKHRQSRCQLLVQLLRNPTPSRRYKPYSISTVQTLQHLDGTNSTTSSVELQGCTQAPQQMLLGCMPCLREAAQKALVAANGLVSVVEHVSSIFTSSSKWGTTAAQGYSSAP